MPKKDNSSKSGKSGSKYVKKSKERTSSKKEVESKSGDRKETTSDLTAKHAISRRYRSGDVADKEGEDLSVYATYTGDETPSYTPIAFRLPKINKFFPNKVDKSLVTFSDRANFPEFDLGFHHFIYVNKGKMELTSQFKDRKKIYLVIHQFEHKVDDYKMDLSHISKTYFDLDPKPNILSRAFYKLWEMLFMYDVIPLDKKKFVSAHLAEGPGSFIQAAMFYRDKFASVSTKDDKYYAVTLHVRNGTYVPKIEDDFVKYYKKEKPQRFQLHRTYNSQEAGGDPDKDDGDLRDPKTLVHFGGGMAEKADLVTADGGFEWQNENTQEQESYALIFSEMLSAVKIQAKGGNFVCKIFEAFTETTLKLICMISDFYDKVYLTKPLTSRPSNSERYLVCLGFKYAGNESEFKRKISVLDSIHKSVSSNKKALIADIFPDYEVPEDMRVACTVANTTISNRQLEEINAVVKFIESQNYHGNVYHYHRDRQIKATKYWNNMYYPNKGDLKTHREDVQKDTINEMNKNDKRISTLAEKLG